MWQMAPTKGRFVDSTSLDTASSLSILPQEASKKNMKDENTTGKPQANAADPKRALGSSAVTTLANTAQTDNETALVVPDVGIFSMDSKEKNQPSSLEGFCATYEKARSPQKEEQSDTSRDCKDDDAVSQQEEKDLHSVEVAEANDKGAITLKPPAAKKQCITFVQATPSFLFECPSDIIQNIYSFLTLQRALVLRCTCRQLYRDTNIFRFTNVDPLHLPPLGPINSQQQEREMCQLASAANLRALLGNTSLPEHTVLGFLKNLVKLAKTDNGEAVSVLLEDGRCLVEPKMLDAALRKDYTKMAAALQQDEEVRAAIRMCATCNANIGVYECFKGKDCKNLPKLSPGDTTLSDNYKLLKYCRACALAIKTFCKCGEAVCQECLDGALSCHDCDRIVCGQDDCTLVTCPGCYEGRCESCSGSHSRMYDPYSDDYYHDRDYGEGYGGYNSDSDYY